MLGLVPLGLAFHRARFFFLRVFIFSILWQGWCLLISATVTPRGRDAPRPGYQQEGWGSLGCACAFQQSPRRARGRGRAASPGSDCTCRDMPVCVGASQPLVFAHTCVGTHAPAAAQLARCETRFSPWYMVLGGCVSMCVWGHWVFLLLPRVYQSKTGLVALGGKNPTSLNDIRNDLKHRTETQLSIKKKP